MKHKSFIKIIYSLAILSLIILFTMCEDTTVYNPGVSPVMQTTMPINTTSYSTEFTSHALTGGGTFSEKAFYYIKDAEAYGTMKEEELRDYILKNGQKVSAPLTGPCIQKVEGLNSQTKYQVISFGKNENGESIGFPVAFTTNATDQLPELILNGVFEKVGETAAKINVEVVNIGSDYLVECGIVWSNVKNPTIENGTKIIQANQQQGVFKLEIDNIKKLTSYYVRGYAIDKNRVTTYSDIELLILFIDPTFIDPRDGTVYTIKLYGGDIWMTQNFKYIPESFGGGVGPWIPNYNGTSVSEAKATEEYKTFGCLYPLDRAIELAPSGWHLATDEEWKRLEIISGMEAATAELLGDWGRATGPSAFKFMKNMKGETRWALDGGWFSNATNAMEFNLVPAGRQWCGGAFQNFGVRVHAWAAKDGHPTNTAYYREIAPWGTGIWRQDTDIDGIPPCVGMTARYVHD
jgi:uncharacterized protein (TIGR02145 family)